MREHTHTIYKAEYPTFDFTHTHNVLVFVPQSIVNYGLGLKASLSYFSVAVTKCLIKATHRRRGLF